MSQAPNSRIAMRIFHAKEESPIAVFYSDIEGKQMLDAVFYDTLVTQMWLRTKTVKCLGVFHGFTGREEFLHKVNKYGLGR